MNYALAPILAALLACGSAAAQAPAAPETVEPGQPKYQRKLPRLEDRQKRKEREAEKPARAWSERRKYFGLGLASSTFGDWSTAETLDDGSYVAEGGDDQGSGYRIFFGIEADNHAFEIGYADLGGATYRAQSDGSAFVWDTGPVREVLDVTALQLGYVYSYPIAAGTRLFASLGVQKWSTDTSYTGTTQIGGPVRADNSTSDWDEVLGAGASFDLSPQWRLRGSYLMYRLNQDTGAERAARINTLELSLAFRY
jgi:opacity protein-like surface antigen